MGRREGRLSMWRRFVRAFRSFFGFFISGLENPELILQQNIRDMNDQTLLTKENVGYKAQITDMTSKIKAAVNAKRDDIAGQYALQLQHIKEGLVRNEQQLHVAEAAFEKANQVKEAFLREVKRKSAEATEALASSRRGEWEKKVADTMEQFQVAGIDATHDEMLRKVQEKTAVNEARMEMALSNVDVQALKLDEEAEKLRASDLVSQFKQEMGMSEAVPPPSDANGVAKTIGRTQVQA
jgi:phage shock protein A